MRDRSPRRAVFEDGLGAAPAGNGAGNGAGAVPTSAPDTRLPATRPAPAFAAVAAGPAAPSAAPPAPPAAPAAPLSIPPPIPAPAPVDLFAPVSASLARGAIVRTRARSGMHDLSCHDGALVAVRVPGLDPSVVGALIGFLFGLIGVVVGGMIGDRIGRKHAAQRLPWLLHTPVPQLVAHHHSNRVITAAEVAAARLLEAGEHYRKLTLQLRDGTSLRYSWDARSGQNAYAEHALRASIGAALTIERKRFRTGSIVATIAAALVALLVLLAIVAAVLDDGPATTGDTPSPAAAQCLGTVQSAGLANGAQRSLYLAASTIDCPSFEVWHASVQSYPASVGGEQNLSADGRVEAGVACDGITRAPSVVVCEEALALQLLILRPNGTYAPAAAPV
jgi:hypothetical protein